MDKFLYKLELVGFDHQERDLIETKKKIISILNLSDQDKKRLLNCHTKLIKNSLDYYSAIQYKKTLDSSGIKCNILRDIWNDYDMNNPAAISPMDYLAVKVIPTVTCAKCGTEQSESTECTFCGFQIKKAVNRSEIHGPDLNKSKPCWIEKKQTSAVSNISTLYHPENEISIRTGFRDIRVLLKKLFRKSRKIRINFYKLAVILGLTILLCVGLLYLCKLLWFMYRMTPVGSYYAIHFMEKAAVINRLFDRNFLMFSVYISISSLVICMIAGIITQFLYIQRYLYRSMGIIGKLLFWAGPLTILVAYYLETVYIRDNWTMIVIYTSVPTFCLFSYCFDLVELLVPELGDVFKFLVDLKDKLVSLMHRGY